MLPEYIMPRLSEVCFIYFFCHYSETSNTFSRWPESHNPAEALKKMK